MGIRDFLDKKSQSPLYHYGMQTLFIACAIILGFYLLELPSNTQIFSMNIGYVFVNLLLVGIGFSIIYLLGQRTRISIAVFLFICMGFGIINYYVVLFKGQPILPTDLLAIGTAAAVSTSYNFEPTVRIIASIVAYIVFVVLLFIFCPRSKINIKYLIINTGSGLGAILLSVFLIFNANVTALSGIQITKWELEKDYSTYGISLSWMQLIQEMIPVVPDGYSAEAAQDILQKYDDKSLQQNIQDIPKPTIVAVMNETFADLSLISDFDTEEIRLDIYNEIAQQALISGNAYQSHTGGGTNDSEFEFLTGSNITFIGNTIFPYLLYDMDGVVSIPEYLSRLGYETTAMHPEAGRNYRRDVIYPQFGFDEFLDISQFQNAETLRNHVTDKETYKKILDILDKSDNPQFIFDVTMQNHGGYETNLIPKDLQVETTLPSGIVSNELNEYISSVHQSEIALQYLTDELNKRQEPIILCFFGDHQPSITPNILNELYPQGLSYEKTVEKYTTSYMIWANESYLKSLYYSNIAQIQTDELKTQYSDLHEVPISLSFLGMRMLTYTGLPLTPYQQFLLDINDNISALNINGYANKKEEWTPLDEIDDPTIEQLLKDYSIVQYDNIFNKHKNELYWYYDTK